MAKKKLRANEGPQIHLNLNVRGLSQSPTLAINEICADLIRRGKKVFRLGLGQSPFPVPEPVVDALRANAHQKDYLPVRGLHELREAVADYHRRVDGLERTYEDVMIAPGSKELMFLLQLVFYGDIVIPTPAWVSYAPQARIVGRHVSFISTERSNKWLMTAEDLERVCGKDPGKPLLVVLNYPSNPTGRTYSDEQLKDIAQVAKSHKVVILSDEIYGALNFEGTHKSIAHYYPEGTIVSAGLSKWCGAGGWRIGTFLFPPALRWLLNGMAVVASETYTSTSAPTQHAAIRAFEGGAILEEYLATSRHILKALGTALQQKLSQAGLFVLEPQGAFYLFPDFEPFHQKLVARGITSSEELCMTLMDETGVATLPGSAFGRSPQELTMRLACVDFDGARAMTGAHEYAQQKTELDKDFLQQFTPKMIEACDRIVDWVGAL